MLVETRGSELAAAMRSCRAAFIGVGIMSAFISVLYLTGSFFMLEVYDRVIPSRSLPTLVSLGILVAVLYIIQGLLDMIRMRILGRIGAALDEQLSPAVFEAVMRAPLLQPGMPDRLMPLRDLDQVRSFLSGQGPTALFDLPWMPLFLAICYLFHPLIGMVALGGGLLLVLLTLLTEILAKQPSQVTTAHGRARFAMAESGARNAEVLRAMGMGPDLARQWQSANRNWLQSHQKSADIVGGIGAISKVMRLALQSGVLAVGAWLVIDGQASAGIIIASSILTARALAPVELAIAHWKSFIAARQSWRRLGDLLQRISAEPEPIRLPRPERMITVEHVSVTPPGVRRLVVQDVSFRLEAGHALGIIGPSASGKSSLARAIVGVWPAIQGTIRIDGAALDQWSPVLLGRHVGYLPQDVELFSGTVAQNIARFDPSPDHSELIAAARAACVLDMILRLPNGFDTQLGEGGAMLSAGQRQRIALARALYRDPFLVVLDEPNANLDSEGDNALTEAITGVKARGGIVVVVAHRPSALAAVDLLLMLSDGRMQAFGPRDEVLRQVARPPSVPAGPAAPAVAPAAGPPGLRVIKDQETGS
jgi:ATP-binding cassette subfamily C protein